MSKDFEWLTGKAEKLGYTYTKENYTPEELEKMGAPLLMQIENINKKIDSNRFGLLISMVIISATRVFGFVGMCVGIGMMLSSFAVFEKLAARKKEISKIMYLRSLK